MGSIYAVVIVNPGTDDPGEITERRLHRLVEAALEPHRYRDHVCQGADVGTTGWFRSFWYTGLEGVSDAPADDGPDPTDGRPCPACSPVEGEQSAAPFCYVCDGLGWRPRWRFSTAVAVSFVRLRFTPEYALTPDGRWHAIESHRGRCADRQLDEEATRQEWDAYWQRLLTFYRHCWAVPVRLKG